jgi:hypothetical protein
LTARSQSDQDGAMRPSLALLASCSFSACLLANAGADKKIGDSAHSLNTQARWGRIEDAALLVQPEYRATFLNHHRRWGREIQLADSEVLNIQLTSDSERASVFVNFSWYAMEDMTLHETTLRQQWTSTKNNFALSSEAVVRGDPALLTPIEVKPSDPATAP